MSRNIMAVTAGGTTSGRVIMRAQDAVALAVGIEQQRDQHAKDQLQHQRHAGVDQGVPKRVPDALVAQQF